MCKMKENSSCEIIIQGGHSGRSALELSIYLYYVYIHTHTHDTNII